MFRKFLLAVMLVSGCSTQMPDAQPTPMQPTLPTLGAKQAANNFLTVVRVVEPVAEQMCRQQVGAYLDCDYQIVVDDRPNQPPNAYQTLDKNNRPIIAFTIPLIAMARNQDELAFVMGHEAAHHIRGHLYRQAQSATAGAIIFGSLASLGGGDASTVKAAQDLGASFGARTYSKNYELEADELGTIITKRAGYDPIKGAQFFTRIPDPGNKFMGTHPPNAARIETVRRTASRL